MSIRMIPWEKRGVTSSVSDAIGTTEVGDGVNPTTLLHAASVATITAERAAIMVVLSACGRACSASLRR